MAATDLTTVQAVRDFLQKPAADEEQDLIIAALITRASLAIMDYTQREFAPASSSTARTFEYEGGGFLDLAPYDIRTVTLVRMDTDEASPTTLAADEYRLYPYPSKNGVYSALRLAPYVVASRARWQQRLVEVTGTWGFSAVPDDVAHQCIVTVADWLRLNVQAFSRTFSLDEQRLDIPEDLPSSVRAGLGRWKRLTYR